VTETEVRKLFLIIQNTYSNFVWDDVKVKIWADLLRDTPFDMAQRNLREYIMNPDEKFPPHPGVLARRPETQGRYVPNAEETRRMLDEMDRQRERAVPMPEEFRRRLKLLARNT